jgi:hypothetical protein
MKFSRKKVIVTIVVILLIVLIINAVYTWGIIFEHDGGFKWSTINIFEDIVTEGYSFVRLGGQLDDPILCIPLVFYVYGIEPPPYTINFAIRNDTNSFKKISIKSVSIEYLDGQKIDHNIEWDRDFKSKFPDMPERYVVEQLPVTVDRRQSCKIRFMGYFINKEGEKISFDNTKYFEYEPYKWRIGILRGSF